MVAARELRSMATMDACAGWVSCESSDPILEEILLLKLEDLMVATFSGASYSFCRLEAARELTLVASKNSCCKNHASSRAFQSQRGHRHRQALIQGQLLGVLLRCKGMESIVVLQVLNLHMVMGAAAPVPHFFDRLDVVLCDMLRCYDDVDAHEMKAMLVPGRYSVATMVVAASSGDATPMQITKSIYGKAIVTKEQDFLKSYGCTMLSSSDGDHAEEAVPLLFGFFHQMWMTTHMSLIPIFNSGDISRMSSVMVHRYLQLNSPNLKCIRQTDRRESHPRGINWYGAQ